VNTVICDADASDLADLLGPIILIWCKDLWGWGAQSFYADRVIVNPEDDPNVKWCLSELLQPWQLNLQSEREFDDWWDRTDWDATHEGCRWQ